MSGKLLLSGLIFMASSLATAQEAVFPSQVEIEDADTLLVELSNGSYRIQLPGIDAPESVINPKLQRDIERTGLAAEVLLQLGKAADNHLIELLKDFHPYRLSFDPQKKDRYGRTPGDLINDKGETLSLRLVEEGYAVPVGPADKQKQELIEAARTARQAGRGLWQSHPEVTKAWVGH
jgi:endonuclease YncB( thermonuclease family)